MSWLNWQPIWFSSLLPQFYVHHRLQTLAATSLFGSNRLLTWVNICKSKLQLNVALRSALFTIQLVICHLPPLWMMNGTFQTETRQIHFRKQAGWGVSYLYLQDEQWSPDEKYWRNNVLLGPDRTWKKHLRNSANYSAAHWNVAVIFSAVSSIALIIFFTGNIFQFSIIPYNVRKLLMMKLRQSTITEKS